MHFIVSSLYITIIKHKHLSRIFLNCQNLERMNSSCMLRNTSGYKTLTRCAVVYKVCWLSSLLFFYWVRAFLLGSKNGLWFSVAHVL